ncbi:VRR-NUC domain-containing protein [Rhizobium sp. RCAM05973]|uniref:VRR-NUC domain-containing protein n=1 Tax=Rhizobium sp. RCAM05973 TaxID=2994066 RepID=UPI0022EBDD92|nr:VRR-NUC domain-containing protein [Rhizobium sp. RCAM05973]
MATTRRVQTTRMGGKRVRIVTTTSDAGTRVRVTDAAPQEWELQAAQVRALRALPEFAKCEADVRSGRGLFTIAGDQNSAKRGPKARMQAIAAGMAAGEHDVRIYMIGANLGLIENKVGNAPFEPSQKVRHPLLAALGFSRQATIRSTSETDAAQQAVATVRGWLSDIIDDKRIAA